jgi:hypothetical protein
MQNKGKWQETYSWQNISEEDALINAKISKEIAGTTALVAILKHYGKLTVPRKNLMELIEVEQVWPNDFITRHGSSMAITYNIDTDDIGFELKYSSDEDHPSDLVAYTCTRNFAKAGFVDHDSPLYKD